MKKRWNICESDNRVIDEMSQQLGISRVLAQILVNRHVCTVSDGQHFLFDTTDDFADPFLMKGMEQGVNRICQAIHKKEKIVIYGDYDVDGVTSTSMLYMVLKRLGAAPDFYIPERQHEGYGIHSEALEKLVAAHTDLLITVDCGISSHDEVAAFAGQLDMIITDHHEPPALLPDAYAVINPKQSGCAYPFKELAGAGVAYKLCQALWQAWHHETLTDYIELAALGTIADLVPLVGENRIIAKSGLQQIKEGHNIGIQALLASAQLQAEQISAGRIAFTIAPRLNAAGRIGHAIQGVKLLLEADSEKARAMADELSHMNNERQAIERDITEQAIHQIEDKKRQHDGTLIAYGTNWHPGVIGIAASRLVERFYRPSLVISVNDGIGKGSCRSIAGFNIYEALQYAQDVLIQFGGHPMAAGFSIAVEHIPQLWDKLNEYAAAHMTPEDYVPQVAIDMALQPQDVTLGLVEELNILEPYGMGNSRPVFSLQHQTLTECRPIGKFKNHLRVSVENTSGGHLNGVGWSMGDIYGTVLAQDEVNVAFTLERNDYNGMSTPQMVLQDIQAGHLAIQLDRTVMVTVYKTLRHYLLGQEMPVSRIQSAVTADLAGQIDGHIVFAALTVLEEIGVLEKRETDAEAAYYLPELNGKMCLETSATFLKYGSA